MKLRFVGLVLAAALPCAPFGYAQSPNVAAPRSAGRTATPIKHIVIIYGENISFDHYFGTYPKAANLPGERPFRATRIAFESDNNARNRAAIGPDGVLPPGFVGFRLKPRSGVANLLGTKVLRRVEALAIENPHPGLMQMDRVHLGGEVNQAPDFYRV